MSKLAKQNCKISEFILNKNTRRNSCEKNKECSCDYIFEMVYFLDISQLICNFMLVQLEKRKLKLNRSTNEFECGFLGFYFI